MDLDLYAGIYGIYQYNPVMFHLAHTVLNNTWLEYIYLLFVHLYTTL